MPLSEAQIQRYSRQILLRGIGGVGQVRLLEGGVEALGEGPALDTAAAYLAAGGCPVRRDGQWRDGGGPARDPAARVAVVLTGGGGIAAAGVAEVRVGSGSLAYRAADGCEACFRALAVEGPPPQGAQATLAGTLAALLCQKLILGALTGVGSVPLEGERSLTVARAPACPACGG